MSTAKKSTDTKAINALHEAFRKVYPNIPVRLLHPLNDALQFTQPEEVAASIERLFELSLFRAGAADGLDSSDCNTMVEAHQLMKAFRNAATAHPLRGA